MHGSLHSSKAYKFYESIRAGAKAKSIIQNGFKIPWSKDLPPFWWKNNKSVYDNWELTRSKVDEWARDGFIKRLEYQPRNISPLHVSIREQYTGEKKCRLCFDGSFVNEYILTEKTKLPDLKCSEHLIANPEAGFRESAGLA